MESCKEKYVILLLMGTVLVFCREEVQSKQDVSSMISEQDYYSEVKTSVETLESVKTETITAVEPVEQDIRVLLTDTAQESPVLDSVLLESEEVLVMEGAQSGEYTRRTLLDMEDILHVGETVTVYPKNRMGSIRIQSLQRSQGTPAYEGVLEITRTDNGFSIINCLDLETYLKYVVPSEMPSSYPEEALKAQAVCARTYAVSQMQENRLDGYKADVDDTMSFQVYNNIPRQKSTDVAVEETEGQIMMWQNIPIQAYFFSTSCGFTSSDQVWGNDTSAGYLESISVSEEAVEAMAAGESMIQYDTDKINLDDYLLHSQPGDFESEESWYRWSVTFPWEEIEKRAAAQFPETGKLEDISVTARSDGGAAIAVLLKGSEGTAIIENEYHVREFLSPQGFSLVKNDGSESTSQKLLPSAYLSLEISGNESEPDALVIHGGGYGHGVGMSQNGAKCMAEEGWNWQEILKTFYHEITFENEFG